MSLSLKRQNDELILIYAPEIISIDAVVSKINQDAPWTIAYSFTVAQKHLRHQDPDENEISFCIGKIQQEYTLIDSDVLGTNNAFYFDNSIKLEPKHLIAYQNISILSKIDKIVDSDVYVGGSHENCIPIEIYNHLIQHFPKKAEIRHYAGARIATILKEYFPTAESYEFQFQKFLNQKERQISSGSPRNKRSYFESNAKIEYHQLVSIRNELNNLLIGSESIPEKEWQCRIHAVLRLLYPQYIAAIREVTIPGTDKYDKRPDFLLIDANGYINILEIKKPEAQLLTKQSSYRHNYVPVRELAGAIQQIEKYIHCLNMMGKEGEYNLKQQLQKNLPASISPRILSPQGILLLGRSRDFNDQQKDDFELIRRQYKHVADIMTYDDLLQRLNNIIASLELEITSDATNV